MKKDKEIQNEETENTINDIYYHKIFLSSIVSKIINVCLNSCLTFKSGLF